MTLIVLQIFTKRNPIRRQKIRIKILPKIIHQNIQKVWLFSCVILQRPKYVKAIAWTTKLYIEQLSGVLYSCFSSLSKCKGVGSQLKTFADQTIANVRHVISVMCVSFFVHGSDTNTAAPRLGTAPTRMRGPKEGHNSGRSQGASGQQPATSLTVPGQSAPQTRRESDVYMSTYECVHHYVVNSVAVRTVTKSLFV